MALNAGRHLGRYEILSPLGAGGMGEVYRAVDTLLGRQVAIKVLHENLAENPDSLKRFQKEAKALAALSHPYILDLHDFGSDQGVCFAVSELLEGETLRERLSKSPLVWQKAVEIAAAVAEGLAAAHSKGVIHRDLKPENIFLTRQGGIKILDFGLARLKPVIAEEELTAVPTISRATESGFVMGTVPYMSPEQVRGEHADARSDIFAFGCVLYEMLAGRRPFSGKNASETFAAILRDDPPKLIGIPTELDRIVQHCLEKDPERRSHSAHDLALALKDSTGVPAQQKIHPIRRRMWIAAAIAFVLVALLVIGLREKFLRAPPAEKIESIAVLPLENLSGDPEQEYFADGMTEELIAKLARISSLRVISRTSVMEYKGKHRKSLPQIAKELRVDAIVEGSVMQSGDRVRITAQLIHAPTDRHLWVESYERDLSDILALQNDVASAVAQEIRAKLTPTEQAKFKTTENVDPVAYQAYLRGISYVERIGPTTEELRLGITMFQRATEVDPSFARAYAALSRAYSQMYFHDRSADSLVKAKQSVDRAFHFHPDLTEAHTAMGFYYYYGFRNYKQALGEFSIAQNKTPNDLSSLIGIAVIHKRQGNFQKALKEFKKALEIDPRNASTANELGIIYDALGGYEEAQRYFDMAISIAPDSSTSYRNKAENYLKWTGDTKKAREIILKIPDERRRNRQLIRIELLERNYQAVLDLLPLSAYETYENAIIMGDCYRLLNKPAQAGASYQAAQNELEKLVKNNPENEDFHSALSFAYAGLHRKEGAIREAKMAVQLLPPSEDALLGPPLLRDLAIIYVMVGEYEAALDQIEYLLSIPTALALPSVPMLRIDPKWDPLRSHPRFQEVLETYSRKGNRSDP